MTEHDTKSSVKLLDHMRRLGDRLLGLTMYGSSLEEAAARLELTTSQAAALLKDAKNRLRKISSAFNY